MIQNSYVGSPTFLAVCYRKFSNSIFPSSRLGPRHTSTEAPSRDCRRKHCRLLDGHGRRLVPQTSEPGFSLIPISPNSFLCRGAASLRPYRPGIACKSPLRAIPLAHPFSLGLPRAPLGSSNISVADANKETPATARPPYKLPVRSFIQPIAYGPANPPRFATELTRAIPEAAANPVRKSPGSE